MFMYPGVVEMKQHTIVSGFDCYRRMQFQSVRFSFFKRYREKRGVNMYTTYRS